MEKSAQYSRKYCQNQHVKDGRARYLRKYRHLLSQLPQRLPVLLEEGSCTVGELRQQIKDEYGVRMHARTIDRYLDQLRRVDSHRRTYPHASDSYAPG